MSVGRIRRLIAIALLALATVACDHATKTVATNRLASREPRSFLAGSIRLEYAENTGGFLSLGADLSERSRQAVFIVGTGVLLLLLVLASLRARWGVMPLAGMALLVAGGASNLIDRVSSGRVVDFLSVGIGPVRTGIFNVADVAIMAGIACIVISQAVTRRTPA
ncbi:MAG TPA: signal peptidase II [Vicinamibacterales bacterium]|nr:signal peptidase II [Vicinamibacterales bacterium]